MSSLENSKYVVSVLLYPRQDSDSVEHKRNRSTLITELEPIVEGSTAVHYQYLAGETAESWSSSLMTSIHPVRFKFMSTVRIWVGKVEVTDGKHLDDILKATPRPIHKCNTLDICWVKEALEELEAYSLQGNGQPMWDTAVNTVMYEYNVLVKPYRQNSTHIDLEKVPTCDLTG